MLFVVDARAGVTPGDEELAQILRESKKHVLVIANKIDDPSQESLALEFHRLGFGEPFPISGLHGSNTGDLLDEVARPAAGRRRARRDRRRRDPRRDPRPPERRQVVALQQAASATERTIVDEVPGTTRDTIDTRARARRPHVPARRHRRPAPQAQAAAGDRLLLGAARARGGRARRRRARPDRRERGDRRGRHHRGRGRAQVALRDADRALEVGHLERSRSRTSAPSCSAGCGSVPTSSRSRRRRAAASRGCSTRSPSSTTATRAASRPPS